MSNLSEMMGETMAKIREMVDVNTIVGNPITTPDGTTLIPVSKVTFGFASGGTDATVPKPEVSVRYGAGSGAGVSINPVAFIVVSAGNVRMIYIDPPTNTTLDRIIDLVPEVIDKFKSKKEQEETF